MPVLRSRSSSCIGFTTWPRLLANRLQLSSAFRIVTNDITTSFALMVELLDELVIVAKKSMWIAMQIKIQSDFEIDKYQLFCFFPFSIIYALIAFDCLFQRANRGSHVHRTPTKNNAI